MHTLLFLALAAAWPIHIIDDASRGADGVRLADFNADGAPDIATGWEEGGEIRVAINPGPAAAKSTWRSIVVGRVAKPEDAVLVDLNADGRPDVVSCTEGDDQSVYVHWSSGEAEPWRTEPIPALMQKAAWMYCLPMHVRNARRPDLVLGAKNPGGIIGRLDTGASDRPADWTWHPLRTCGWIMSIIDEDMDGDGDADILFSDRRGDASGVFWLERTGDASAWPEHAIGLRSREVMFITAGDVDRDGDTDIAAAVKPRDIVLFVRNSAGWTEEIVPFSGRFGTSKGVAIADIAGDNTNELIVTCEEAEHGSGVFYLARARTGEWEEHDISGAAGIKYDRVECLDLDADGDLDVVTCEEREINAVLWYENPGDAPR